jgi:hypothetical protein
MHFPSLSTYLNHFTNQAPDFKKLSKPQKIFIYAGTLLAAVFTFGYKSQAAFNYLFNLFHKIDKTSEIPNFKELLGKNLKDVFRIELKIG